MNLYFDDRQPLIFIRTLSDLDAKKLNCWHAAKNNIVDENLLDYTNSKMEWNEMMNLEDKFIEDQSLDGTVDYITATMESISTSHRYIACLSKRGPLINQNINSSKKCGNSMFKINDIVFKHLECSYVDDDYQYLFCKCERYTFVV